MLEIPVYYEENSYYGECNECFKYDDHDLILKYQIKIPTGRIFHIYECRNCNIEMVSLFFNNSFNYVYTSLPHFMWKSFRCGKKIKLSDLYEKFSFANLNRISREMRAGLYSGYPLCCVTYFSFISSMIPNRSLYKDFIYFTRRNLDMPGSGSTHINCPLCNYIGKKNIGKFDPPGVNCLDVTFTTAIISAIKWKLSSKKFKESYNKTILTHRAIK